MGFEGGESVLPGAVVGINRQETDTRSVRKNVSLPAWLSFMAEKNGINCSQLLQKALKRELRIN